MASEMKTGFIGPDGIMSSSDQPKETGDRIIERISILASIAREYLHRYGYLMTSAGEDVIDEVVAIESVISELTTIK